MNEPQAKLKGKYVPCQTECGQPEPCFGCDSGDYEYPSIPGKPETYSPTYNKFHAMLTKVIAKEPLTEDEASEVYYYINKLVYYAVPEGGLLLSLYDQLGREHHTGLRCSVCGKFQDASCTLGC